jgi:hypothetical protein
MSDRKDTLSLLLHNQPPLKLIRSARASRKHLSVTPTSELLLSTRLPNRTSMEESEVIASGVRHVRRQRPYLRTYTHVELDPSSQPGRSLESFPQTGPVSLAHSQGPPSLRETTSSRRRTPPLARVAFGRERALLYGRRPRGAGRSMQWACWIWKRLLWMLRRACRSRGVGRRSRAQVGKRGTWSKQGKRSIGSSSRHQKFVARFSSPPHHSLS